MEEMRKLFMPVLVKEDGSFSGILSDDSIDRDDELISGDLIREWASKAGLPALADHEAKMEKWVGGWKGLQHIEKGMNHALQATPWFFSKEANPRAEQVRLQIVEAASNGLNAGISIGARPLDSKTVTKGDKTFKMWTKAELLEASWVVIPSNKNAYVNIAKKFDIGGRTMEKEVEVLNNIDAKPAVLSVPAKPKEEEKVDVEVSKKDFEEAINKRFGEIEQRLEGLNKGLDELKKSLQKAEKDDEEEKKKKEKEDEEKEKLFSAKVLKVVNDNVPMLKAIGTVAPECQPQSDSILATIKRKY